MHQNVLLLIMGIKSYSQNVHGKYLQKNISNEVDSWVLWGVHLSTKGKGMNMNGRARLDKAKAGERGSEGKPA